jgi:hypothetical protein
MPEMRGKRVMTNVYVDPPVLNDLKQLSAHTRISLANYIREGIALVLEKYAKELRRAKK